MAAGLWVLQGCDQQNVASFGEERVSGVNFATDSTSYSFLGNPEPNVIEEVPVQILGSDSEEDRTFEVEVIEGSLTTAESEDYELLEGTVEAGSIIGTLPVELFNSEKLDESEISLHLRIADGGDFQRGAKEAGETVIYWTNKVIVPDWSYYQYFFCSYPSSEAYRAIVESTGVERFDQSDYLEVGQDGGQALGRKFGDYVREYNEQNPDNPMTHDDGPQAGEEIEPIFYSQNKEK